MSKLSWAAMAVLAVGMGVQAYTIYKQQEAIDGLIGVAEMHAELDVQQEEKLWDLHRRVRALEAEDQRLLAHIKWFVMRRSGTDELRKMEQVVAKLETHAME